jgi:hypothetical protein
MKRGKDLTSMVLGCKGVTDLVWRNIIILLFNTLHSIARNEQGGQEKTTIILALVMTAQCHKKVDDEMQ